MKLEDKDVEVLTPIESILVRFRWELLAYALVLWLVIGVLGWHLWNWFTK